MQKSVQMFKDQLCGIRWGTVSAGVIDTVRIPYQGQKVPLNQLANSFPNKGQVCVTPFDPAMTGLIASTLKEAGFDAYQFSKTSVVVQCKTGQRDKVVVQIKKLAEEARVSVRNIRRKARQSDKKIDKPLQALTDEQIGQINSLVEQKLSAINPYSGPRKLDHRLSYTDGSGEGRS